jgi:hypothetical protein
MTCQINRKTWLLIFSTPLIFQKGDYAMSNTIKKDEKSLTLKDYLNIIWKYLNQPLFDSNVRLILNFKEFKEYFLQTQLLERCWNLEYIQFLEHCWNLEFESEKPKSETL